MRAMSMLIFLVACGSEDLPTCEPVEVVGEVPSFEFEGERGWLTVGIYEGDDGGIASGPVLWDVDCLEKDPNCLTPPVAYGDEPAGTRTLEPAQELEPGVQYYVNSALLDCMTASTLFEL